MKFNNIIIYKKQLMRLVLSILTLVFVTACSSTRPPLNHEYIKERYSNTTPEQLEILSVVGDAKLGERRSSKSGVSVEVIEHYISAMGADCRKLSIIGQHNNSTELVCSGSGISYFVPPIYENSNLNIGS